MHYNILFLTLTLALSFGEVAFAVSRTSPPSGALVVRAGTTTLGEYATLSSAVAALPSDSSAQSIFLYPGTYTEQVYIGHSGPVTLYGYTTDTSTYTANQVNVQYNKDATSAGGGDPSGTVRIHTNGVKVYNINIKNTYGKGIQAIALSQQATKAGFYACGFYGYQDTIYANEGLNVYLKSFIQGATDFIYGARANAYFARNTISITGPGWVTANGRSSNDSTLYLFENNQIVLDSTASSDTSGKTYLGRPWRDYAKVIFKNTVITAPMNKALWAAWTSTQDVSNVFYADYASSGSGVSGVSRPSWVKTLSASDAATYTISSTLGSDYATWVDTSYL